MINLKTNCEECMHNKVCRNKNHAKYLCERLSDLTFGEGPNDDCDWNTISEHYHINIDISCKDFEKIRPVARTVTSRELEFKQHDK